MPDRSPSTRSQFEAIPAPRRLSYPAASQLPEDPRRRLSTTGVVLSVLVAAIVAVIVFVAGHALPKTFQATSEFRVTVPNQQNGVTDSSVTAENDLASQYAGIASSSPILDAATAILKVPAGSLTGAISAAAVNAQNVVQITASASTPTVANARAQAAGNATVTYLQKVNMAASTAYSATAVANLDRLSKDIDAARGRLAKDSPNLTAIDRATLSSLETQRATAEATIAQDAAGGQPLLQTIDGGGNASQTAPKPSEYALIGFVVALLIALRAVYVLGVPGFLPGADRARR